MPQNSYIRFLVDGQPLDINSTSEFPVSLNFSLEDAGDFQKKTSGNSFDVSVPASKTNNVVSNSLFNPSIQDLTEGEIYRNPRRAVIEYNSFELMVGKAFLKRAAHKSRPTKYDYDVYGDSADWMIDLKESTLWDFLKGISFVFNRNNIANSWSYDGRDPVAPYVFAPVRYGASMDENDDNVALEYLKPSISVYWLIYFGFQSLGYKVESTFMDSDYFRRLVMPWTWGAFLNSSGTKLENLKFLARSAMTHHSGSNKDIFYINVENETTEGAYDNSGTYAYNQAQHRMVWTYLPTFNYGTLTAAFHLQLDVDANVVAGSDAKLTARWYKNNVIIDQQDVFQIQAPVIGSRPLQMVIDRSKLIEVSPGDTVGLDLFMDFDETRLGRANMNVQVLAFELEYFRIELGATIQMENYLSLKNYKFLDFLRGVFDFFNLSQDTDSISKVVKIEPTHPYVLPDGPRPGYFNGNYVDWSKRQDLSKESAVTLDDDSERELTFKLKNDPQDGALKIIQDRYKATLAASKYVLPERFKSGQKDVENRFFSPVMHFDVEAWKNISGVTPQMIVMTPENISQTSKVEAQNTFQPKLAYYKGMQQNIGWKYDNGNTNNYPFMFAVNYMPGGENDPVLSYSDERIGNELMGYKLAPGLLKRFFLQRMANTRNGELYDTWIKFFPSELINTAHREHKVINGDRWELVSVKDYRPTQPQSTSTLLRKTVPLTQQDFKAVFPSETSVLNDQLIISKFDLKYYQLKCLYTDIPK